MLHLRSIVPRRAGPGLVVATFTVLMTACVLVASTFKVMHERKVELERGRIDIQNLAHSLAEHATNTIQTPDTALSGMADLLRYQDPLPERFNKYLANSVAAMPQVRELGVLDVEGRWRYSSLAETPKYSNGDRRTSSFIATTPALICAFPSRSIPG